MDKNMNIFSKQKCIFCVKHAAVLSGAGLNPRQTPFSLSLDEYPFISDFYFETSDTLWYMIYAQITFGNLCENTVRSQYIHFINREKEAVEREPIHFPKLYEYSGLLAVVRKSAYKSLWGILICHNVCQNHYRGKLEDCRIRSISNVHLWRGEKAILGTDGWQVCSNVIRCYLCAVLCPFLTDHQQRL